MNLPRITLPWIARRRDRDAVRRRSRRGGAHRAETPRTRSSRTKPGPRAVVGGALAVLALSATTATAATGGPAEAESTGATEPLSVTAPTTVPSTALDPVVVVSDEASVAQATDALERATTVTEDHSALTESAENKIVERADAVADLLAASTTRTDSASRSGDRSSPATSTETEADDAAAAAAAAEEPAAAETEPEAAETAEIATADEVATSSVVLPDPSTVFPADGTDALVLDVGTEAEAEAGTEADADATDAAETSEELSAELADATESLTTLLDDAEAATVAVKQAPEEPAKAAEPATPAEVLHAQAAAAKKASKKLEKYVDATAGAANGEIPSDALSSLKFAKDEELRHDAARQLERLNKAYRAKFGENLTIRDSYRSYASQVAVKASRGSMAAVPGYSNHGWGVAVDINGGVETFGTAQYEWLRKNGPKFGWDNPDWAQAGARKPEAWHWEYTPLS